MDSDSDSFYEESSSDEEQEGTGPININVEVNLEEPPESPPPGPPSPAPAPVPQQVPVEEPELGWELPDNGENFLNCFTRQDVLELKNWALETRARLSEEGYVVVAPIISQNFVGYLLENYGPQWELEFLRPAAWPVFERLMAYVVGYAKLTSYNKQLLRGLYYTWSVEERAERLRSLAESGGFLEIE